MISFSCSKLDCIKAESRFYSTIVTDSVKDSDRAGTIVRTYIERMPQYVPSIH